MDIIQRSIQIAKNDLKHNYAPNGIFAGPHQHKEYWSRDSAFAILGCNAIGDFEISKKNIEYFLRYQRKDGLLPLRIERRNHLLNYLKIKKNYKEPKPRFKAQIPFSSDVQDSNTLIIIAISDYFKKSNDLAFVKENFPRLEKAIEWSKKQCKNHLIWEGLIANRADDAIKWGHVLYTNVIYCKALIEMDFISKKLKLKRNYKKDSELVRSQINELFWNGEYYNDWFDYKNHKNFNSDGNTLAVMWEIADKKKSQSIIGFVEKNNLFDPPMISSYPKLSFYRKINSIVGIGNYSDMSWIFVACFYLMARKKIGLGIKKEFNLLCRQIIKYDGFYEVYDYSGKPLKSLFYKSETNFAWSAGTFLHMVKDFNLLT